MNLRTVREFRKHQLFSDIYAVEFVDAEGKRDPVAAHRCTRPEELTRGALPVLGLDMGDDYDFYTRNAGEFELWTPPTVDADAFAAIIAAERECAACEQDFKTADSNAKAKRNLFQKATDDLRRVVREASAVQPVPPLLALIAGDTPDYNANLERPFTNDDRDDDPNPTH